MKFYFLSDSDNGGGIAFNVKKINQEIIQLGYKSTAIYLNRPKMDNFYRAIFDNETISIYCTSIKTLYIASFISICRMFLLKKTKVAQIIYHPRFIDSTISYFRAALNKLISKIPSTNIYYYSDECIIASKLEDISNVNKDRIIGLASVYGDITSKKIALPKLGSEKFIISTVARFVDFKIGYLLALINYVKTRKEIVLYIVGYGPKEDLINQAANDADNIIILGKLQIENAKYVVENSDLYVGMGTTLVDATSIGTPAIVAIESSSKALTTGYFGQSSAMNFGEFNKETNYLDLIEFIDKSLFNTKLHECIQSAPWIKLINSNEKLKINNHIYSFIFITLIPIIKFIRKFNVNDYH